MKNKYLSILVIFLFSLSFNSSNATTHIVEVEDFEFNPQNFSVQVGDTIIWTWHDGFHTTTSDLVPTGASHWDAPIESSTPTFMYVVTHPGFYSYHCTPHQSMGMNGTFTASGTTSIIRPTQNNVPFRIAVDNENSKVILRYTETLAGSSEIRVMNISGKVVFRSTPHVSVKDREEVINLTGANQGIYLIELINEKSRFVKKVIIGR